MIYPEAVGFKQVRNGRCEFDGLETLEPHGIVVQVGHRVLDDRVTRAGPARVKLPDCTCLATR
jgi:hypothetical protein